jgi:hypothetical protein
MNKAGTHCDSWPIATASSEPNGHCALLGWDGILYHYSAAALADALEETAIQYQDTKVWDCSVRVIAF